MNNLKKLIQIFTDSTKLYKSSAAIKKESIALSGKMLLVRIVENNKIDAYFRACSVMFGLLRRVRKEIR